MSTPAIAYLKQRRIPCDIVKYEHREKGAEFAARATGYPLQRTVKTLVVEMDRNNFCLALLPGDRELNLKKLSALFGAKRTALAESATAQRLTGYPVGGISPFGVRRPLRSVLDESVLAHEQVLINGGRRGLMLEMEPGNIVAALACPVASIAQ
jgi:Cys-tRNA(Pro)/Cys-tRNA(Cys) deacylase